MTRIYLSIIAVTCVLLACTKRPAPPAIPSPVDSVASVRLPPTFDLPKPRPVRIYREATPRPPVIVTFAKGSSTLSQADKARLGKLRLRKSITVTGYASKERGKRPAKIEAARNYALSMKRAQAVCAEIKVACTPIAGGETDMISSALDGNRIAGFIP